jgi:hypothetical protein
MTADPMTAQAAPVPATENRARLSRTTCGWRRPSLDRDAVRRYWRDVHSPAIARRAGIHWYRHSPFDPVDPGLLAGLATVELDCPADEQLMWQSDVVYLDEDGAAAFMASPSDPAVVALLLADIEMIVERSTTYRSVGDNLRTWVERTPDPVPLGVSRFPRYGLFLRAGGDQGPFRQAVSELSARWSALGGVTRLRTCLFDPPDMEAERRAGYPVKTHPIDQQYQAWIDLALSGPEEGAELVAAAGDVDLAAVAALHAYPVPAVYTFVYDGHPTLAGLRGFAAVEAIDGLGADHARDPRLLEWMYGPIGAGR